MANFLLVARQESVINHLSLREHANQVKRSKQRLLEQIQSHRFPEWDREQDPETHCYDTEWPSQPLQFFSPELDPRNHKPTGLWSQKLLTIVKEDLGVLLGRSCFKSGAF